MGFGLKYAYFNYAGLSPESEISGRGQETTSEFRNLLFSEIGVKKYIDLLNDCRDGIRLLLNAPGAEGIALLPNASFGLNIAINSLVGRPGQAVVTSDQEHPAVKTPLELAARRGVKVESVGASTAGEMVEEVERLVKNRSVGLIVISHVSYTDGRVHPVEDIGRIANRERIPYIVDGAQAVGQVEVDVPRIQPWVYVFSGHKWLFGPMGTGGMWVSKDFLDGYEGVWSSWASSSVGNGTRFEGGTMNFGLMVGFLEAIKNSVRFRDQRHKALENLRGEIVEGLSKVVWSISQWKDAHAPGIITYRLPSRITSWELAEILLNRYGIVVKPFRPPEEANAIRISFSPWTGEEEVRKLVSSLLQEMAKFEGY